MIRPFPRKSGKPWPLNVIPEPRPADWGVGMTVCIAAHCYENNDSECIFCVTDAMISTGEMSADLAARKIRGIAVGWNAMFAGNDISYVTPILRHVIKTTNGKPVNLDSITNAFVDAYKEQLRLRAESEVLTPLGYSLEEFKTDGLSQLGAEAFTRALYDVQQQIIDLTFLIAGFDGDESHIFTVSSPGKIDYYSDLGFWAIGSGQTHALGSIFNSTRRLRFLDRADALYRICEAKFNSENALGVGPTTIGSLIEPGKVQHTLYATVLEKFRPIWEQTKVVDPPPEAKIVGSEALKPRPAKGPSEGSASQSLTKPQ
jgi:hypothetical protein